MIPKTIHYIWFGGKPIPPLALACINSWKKYLAEYTFVLWN
ncbi:MAG: glycosyl transferase, partial [Bacteroidales bacterium]